MASSSAPYSVSKGFSNSRKFSRFLIDSLLLFELKIWYSPYCLIWRVATPRIVHSGELQMYEFYAETLACHLIRGADTPHIVYYWESLLPASSTLHVHVHGMYMFMMHVNYPCSMFMSISMLHVHVYVHATCPCPSPCCMSIWTAIWMPGHSSTLLSRVMAGSSDFLLTKHVSAQQAYSRN